MKPIPIPPELIEIGPRTMQPGDLLTFSTSDDDTPMAAMVYLGPLGEAIQVMTYANPGLLLWKEANE